MSLVVWLPLNGNLENQGLSNITVTNNGATVDNNGKIGKCYSFNGSSNYLMIPTTLSSLNKEFSICAWVKFNSTSGTYTIYTSRTVMGQGIAIFRLSSNNIRFDDGTQTYFGDYYCTTEWTHICVTRDNTSKKLYINGELKQTVTSIGNMDGIYSGNASIGASSLSGSELNNFLNGKLNDFRIYDHCLSPKEVKEISKALVLHYKLDNGGNGNSNLLKGNYQVVITSTTTTKSGSLKFTLTADELKALAGQTLCFSYRVKADGERKVGTASSSLNNRFGIHGSFNYTATGTTSATQLYPFAGALTYSGPETIVQSTWTVPTNIGTINSNLSFAIQTEGTNYASPSNANNIWFIKDVKLEIGNKATPWLPNENDSEYITLGYNIEYDCSGYRHNGTKSGTITCDADSPRYTTSYKFNTGSDYIKTNFSKTMDELSISFWVKPSSSNGGHSIICSNYNNPSGGLWLATNCEGCSVWAYHYAYMNVSGSLANNIWHHCVYTFKNGVSKWYVDGEEKTLTKNTYTGTTMPITDLTIGNSYTGTSWNTKRYGNLSDFRLYCTALSAEDIAELYHSAVIVDNTGKTYAYEYFEA